MKKLILLAIVITGIVVGVVAVNRPVPQTALPAPTTAANAPMGYTLVPDKHSQGYGYIIPQFTPQSDVIVNTGQAQLKQ